jgi:hypothetical protein
MQTRAWTTKQGRTGFPYTQFLTDRSTIRDQAHCPSPSLRKIGVRRLHCSLSGKFPYGLAKKLIGAPVFIANPNQDE